MIADVKEHPFCAEVVKKEHQKVLNFLTFIDDIHHNAVGMLGEFFIEIEKALLSQVPHTFVQIPPTDHCETFALVMLGMIVGTFGMRAVPGECPVDSRCHIFQETDVLIAHRNEPH